MKDTKDLKKLIEWQEARWGSDHPKVIAALETMADLLQMDEKYPEAEPLYWQILEKKHKLYGDNDLRVADTIYDLACLHEKQDNWSECERLYKWTCDIRCRLLPQGDQQLDESISKVKEAAAKQGHEPQQNFPAAPEVQKSSLPVSFNWGKQIESVNLLIAERSYAAAATLLSALAELGAAIDPESQGYAESLRLLGRMHFMLRDYELGMEKFETALEIMERIHGPASKETAVCLEDMADLQCKLGDASQAEFLFKWATQILESLPDSQAQVSRVQVKLNSLSSLCKVEEAEREDELKQAQEAKARLASSSGARAKSETKKEALEAQADESESLKSRGPEHVSSYLWTQYFNTGKKALEKKDYVGAEMMFARALDKTNEFGVQDPRLWQTLSQMAAVHLAQGKLVRAESLFKSAQQFCEKTLGPAHPENAQYFELLGKLYEDTGDLHSAAAYYDKLVTLMVKANRPLVEYASVMKRLHKIQAQQRAEHVFEDE